MELSMYGNCMVSVVCATYNQKEYIRETIESIVQQKVDFEYEIIIHDDASTDGTTEIIKEFESKYSQIRVIYEEKNKYLNGIPFLWDVVENYAKGKYIALCDGDDYWIDDFKLQSQYDIMESHPECDLCACWGCTVTEDGKKEISQIRPRIGDGILSVEDTILGGGQYLVTAGLFFRQTLSDALKSLDIWIMLFRCLVLFVEALCIWIEKWRCIEGMPMVLGQMMF
jgi:glycosyltransferase involved in cell wall biosynthesis